MTLGGMFNISKEEQKVKNKKEVQRLGVDKGRGGIKERNNERCFY